jgi:hypothetical protein
MRDFMAQDRQAEYKLYPYAKDLSYRADGMVTMTLEIYNDTRTDEFTFGFMCSPQLRRFLDRTIGDEHEEEE